MLLNKEIITQILKKRITTFIIKAKHKKPDEEHWQEKSSCKYCKISYSLKISLYYDKAIFSCKICIRNCKKPICSKLTYALIGHAFYILPNTIIPSLKLIGQFQHA